MAEPVDVHALANAPGYGKAQAAVRAAGHWAEDATAPEWIIEVTATATITTIVHVRADNFDDAKRLAYEKADDGAEWEIVVCSVDINHTNVVFDPT